MSNYNFNEQTEEYSAKHGKALPVFQTPKYKEAKQKAIEIIASNLYGVGEADFWILMNTTKTEKMAYTGLIISHNGCLKINDGLTDKFKPECVTLDKDGYNGSLVYSYCSPEQGIYEVGEVSNANCTNAYPYAMAYKRLFDRVVLKLSKLAYSGIMSDSESDEFKGEPTEAKPEQQNQLEKIKCDQLIALGTAVGVKNVPAALCKRYGVTTLAELTEEQYKEAKTGFELAAKPAN